MKLIINAEDFGISQSVNKGIFEGLNQKFLSSASIFMNAKYTNEAMEYIKSNNIKNVGVHLNITYGKPISAPNKIPSLMEGTSFRYMCSMPFFAKYKDVLTELDAQIQKFLSFGIKPSHLDFHHYFYSSKEVYSAYLDLAKKYNLPVRSMTERSKLLAKEQNIKTTDLFFDDFHSSYHGYYESLKYIAESLKNKDGFAELMTTPGYVDEYLVTQTSYLSREDELNALKQAKKDGLWEQNNIELVSFLDI